MKNAVENRWIRIVHKGPDADKQTRHLFLRNCFNEIAGILNAYEAAMITRGYSNFAFTARARVPADRHEALTTHLKNQSYQVEDYTPDI